MMTKTRVGITRWNTSLKCATPDEVTDHQRSLAAPRSFSLITGVSRLGMVGLCLLSSNAFAQDPAPADPEPAPAEEAPAAPAADAPAGEAPPADPAATPEAVPEAGVEGAIDPNAVDAALAANAELGGPEEGLAEVVVTVDRRPKNLQKYSGTAVAFSEDDLSSVGIQNLRDVASKVPGMQIGNQEGNTEVYIRGIGSDNNTELGDPAVAVHLDGIYLPRPRGMGAMFYDIARVEVNSGPQGTLRGRNALGGTVNIVANQPKLGEYEANAEATFGTFAQRRYQGMVNIPLGDSFAWRTAAFSEVHDPHWENGGPIYDIKGPESIDSYAFRSTMKWQPSNAFTATVAYDFTRERGTGWLGANFQGILTREVDDAPAPIAPEDIDNPRRIYNRGMQSSLDMKHHGARAELRLDAGPVLFELTGSYRNMRFLQNNGGTAGLVSPYSNFDGGTPDNFSSSYWNQGSESIVAEFRMFAPDTDRFRWTVGAFLFDETQDTFLGQAGDQSRGFGGAEFPMPKTKGGSIAGFADGTFDVTETFRVLAGARVTNESKSRKGGMWSLYTGWPEPPNNGNVRFGTEGFQFHGVDRTQLALPPNHTVTDRVNLFLDGVKSFGARDTIPQYLCADPPTAQGDAEQEPRLRLKPNGHFECAHGIHPDLLAQEADGGSPFGITAIAQNNETSPTFLDWRAGVELDLGKDSLLYATVSTGHKSGGFNDTSSGGAPPTPINTGYTPEDVLAFELGSKNQLLDRHLRLNASAFFYKYNDQVFQTIVAVLPPNEDGTGGSNAAVRQNASSSNIYGLDLDVTYALPAGFEVEVHALLMDARFGDGVTVHDARLGFDIGEYPVDIGGNWLPRVSPVTLNYALSQAIFTEAGMFDWVISGQTRAKHYMTPFNGEGELLPAAADVPGSDDRIPRDDMGNIRGSYAALQENPARLTDVVPAYTRFDLGAGWKHPDSRIQISAFVNNVFNIGYATSIIATPGLNLRFFNPPRTAGVRFRVDW